MAEFLTQESADSMYGKKGSTNAGLTLGIIGTALGAYAASKVHKNSVSDSNITSAVAGFALGDVIGMSDDRYVAKDTFWQQNVALEKELGQGRYDSLKANYDLYVTLDAKNTAVATKMAQLEAALPLTFQLAQVNAERYADEKIAKVDKNMAIQALATEAALAQKVDGQMGLPWSSIISGIPRMPRCTLDVTCPSSSSAS